MWVCSDNKFKLCDKKIVMIDLYVEVLFIFVGLFEEVKVSCEVEFNVMMVVIVGVGGWLLVCIVLFKVFDVCGFVFYIYLVSYKGWEL